jgi:SHS2 domain-containing protein
LHTWVDHTSELQLEIEAPTEAGVFEHAVLALRELLEEGEGREVEAPEGAVSDSFEIETRALTVVGRDRGALLAELLGELVFCAEMEDFVPVRLSSLELSDRRLTAEVLGYRGRPRQLVKAVTYHGLGLEPSSNGWRASVVLDV